MSFDEIFDLTAGVYFNFYNISEHHTACKDEVPQNLRSHGWSVFLFLHYTSKKQVKAAIGNTYMDMYIHTYRVVHTSIIDTA